VDEFEMAARFKEALAPSALQPENLAEYYTNVGVFRAVAGPAGVEPGVTENDPGADLRFGVGVGVPDREETRLVFQPANDGTLLVGGSFVAGSAAGLIRVLPATRPRLRP
jgi:hypothetical protein